MLQAASTEGGKLTRLARALMFTAMLSLCPSHALFLWASSGSPLGLLWASSEPPLNLLWSSFGPLLVLLWASFGPLLDLLWASSGPPLGLLWASAVVAGHTVVCVLQSPSLLLC